MSCDETEAPEVEVIEVDFTNPNARPEPKGDEYRLERRQPRNSACAYSPPPAIYTDTREVECVRCGAPLDPFEVLLGFVKNWKRNIQWTARNRACL